MESKHVCQINVWGYTEILIPGGGGGGGTLGLFRWGCAAGSLEPLAYTRASSSEFCYPMLD